MKPRVLTLILGLVGLLLAGAITAAFAYNAKDQTPTASKPKNEAVFNWGSSS